MLAIRLILSLFSIRIPILGINFSFVWIPVYIVGFYFGPFFGLFFGILSDTFAWLLSGSVWFWMYAIQEPCIGLLSGIIGSCFFLFNKKSIKQLIVIQQLIVFFFVIFTIVIVFSYYNKIDANQNINATNNFNKKLYVILLSIFLSCFLLFNEVQTIIMYLKYKKHKVLYNYTLYLYISILIIISIIIFSFILGPITQIKFYEFLNNNPPSNYLKYGTMFYLLPRVIKESFKTPIYILLVFLIVFAIKHQFHYNINSAKNKWNRR